MPPGGGRRSFRRMNETRLKEPVRVAVTGAAGQIGYSLLFRIATGEMLGRDQPVILQLVDIPPAMKAVDGVAMELNDCAFPLLAGIEAADTPQKGFQDTQFALLVGGHAARTRHVA